MRKVLCAIAVVIPVAVFTQAPVHSAGFRGIAVKHSDPR
jgi:hypothetical protein